MKDKVNVITVYPIHSAGTMEVLALFGTWEEKRGAPIWPSTYLHDVKKSEYYADFGTSIYLTSHTIYELRYKPFEVDQAHAEYMAATMKRLNIRLAKLEEVEGYCASFGTFVTRLSRITKAALVYKPNDFKMGSNVNWQELKPINSAGSIDRVVAQLIKNS